MQSRDSGNFRNIYSLFTGGGRQQGKGIKVTLTQAWHRAANTARGESTALTRKWGSSSGYMARWMPLVKSITQSCFLWGHGSGFRVEEETGESSLKTRRHPMEGYFPPCFYCPSFLLHGAHILSLWSDILTHLPTQDW